VPKQGLPDDVRSLIPHRHAKEERPITLIGAKIRNILIEYQKKMVNTRGSDKNKKVEKPRIPKSS
jgi:hypothetical protein